MNRYLALLLLPLIAGASCVQQPRSAHVIGTLTERPYYRHDGRAVALRVIELEDPENIWPDALPLLSRKGTIWTSDALHTGDRVEIIGKVSFNGISDDTGAPLGNDHYPGSTIDKPQFLQLRVHSAQLYKEPG